MLPAGHTGRCESQYTDGEGGVRPSAVYVFLNSEITAWFSNIYCIIRVRLSCSYRGHEGQTGESGSIPSRSKEFILL